MIKLAASYVVQVDVHNYTLMRDRGRPDKKGKPTYETIGYYGDLGSAVQGAVNHLARLRLSDGDHSLEEALRVYRDCNRTFSKLLDELIKNQVKVEDEADD